MHTIQHSKSRHNIFSKVDHDKTYIKQHNSSFTNGSNNNNNNNASSSSVKTTPNSPLTSPIATSKTPDKAGVDRKLSTSSVFSNNNNNGSSNNLPDIDLHVRKKLANNDLAVKLAARSPVFTPAKNIVKDTQSPAYEDNIFGMEDDVGYVESEYGDLDDDDEVKSVASNRSERLENMKRAVSTKSFIKLPNRIVEMVNEDDEDADHDPHDGGEEYHDDEDDEEFDDDSVTINKGDPKMFRSPLDAHQKFMRKSKSKNHLRAIQALSAKKIIPTKDVLNESKKARLSIKHSSASIKDTLANQSLLRKTPSFVSSKNLLAASGNDMDMEDDDASVGTSTFSPAPMLGKMNSPKKASTFNLATSPSFRFVNSISAKSPSFMKSFKNLWNDEDNADDEDNLPEEGTVQNFIAPIDKIDKPMIQRALSTKTFSRLNNGNPAHAATMLRALDSKKAAAQEDDIPRNEGDDEMKSVMTEKKDHAYHIPDLTQLDDHKQSKFIKSIDSFIHKLTFVEADKRIEPPKPIPKPALTVENVFGDCLIKANIPQDEMITDEDFQQILAAYAKKDPKNPTANNSSSQATPKKALTAHDVILGLEAELKNGKDNSNTPLKSPYKQYPTTASNPNASQANKGKPNSAPSSSTSLPKLDLSHVNATPNKGGKKPLLAEKKSHPPVFDESNVDPNNAISLSNYTKSLSRSAQSFIGSLLQHNKEHQPTASSSSNQLVPKAKDKASNNNPLSPKGPQTAVVALSANKEVLPRMSLPYDEEESQVHLLPRLHPFASPEKGANPYDDPVEYDYQYSTNSYVPRDYINHTELGIYDRSSPRPYDTDFVNMDPADFYYSERHIAEMEDTTVGKTQPVIYLPPDSYHLPLSSHSTHEASHPNLNGVLIYNPSLTASTPFNSSFTKKSKTDDAFIANGPDSPQSVFDVDDNDSVKAAPNESLFPPQTVVSGASYHDIVQDIIYAPNASKQPHYLNYVNNKPAHPAYNDDVEEEDEAFRSLASRSKYSSHLNSPSNNTKKTNQNKFSKSNPELLHTASNVDLRGEILQFLKQAPSSNTSHHVQQYEQYLDRTHHKDKKTSYDRDDENYFNDHDSDTIASNETPFYQRNTLPNHESGDHLYHSPLDDFHAMEQQKQSHLTPQHQQLANKKLKERLDARYAGDREGDFHMKNRVQKYLHDGIREETKILRQYHEEIDGWK